MSGRPTHTLEAWTRRTFGAGFARLVLLGLLDEAETREERITVRGVDQAGRKSQVTLAVTKPCHEAWGLKPLVLAALLKQLVEKPVIERALAYSFKTLLGELKWDDIPASRRAVADTICFYSDCTYSARVVQLLAGTLSRIPVRPQLLAGIAFGGVKTPQCGQYGDDGNTVLFGHELVAGLRRGRVAFADMDFGELRRGGAAPGVGPRRPPESVAETAPPDGGPPRPPRPNPVLRFEITPVSKMRADLRPAISARAVGETVITVDTGAKASAVLRLVNRVAARHPPDHPCPLESADCTAEYVHREFDRRLREEFPVFLKSVAWGVCRDALNQSSSLIHSMPPIVSKGRPGPRPVWHSTDHLVSSLERAVEAIEFDREWKPPPGTELNRGLGSG